MRSHPRPSIRCDARGAGPYPCPIHRISCKRVGAGVQHAGGAAAKASVAPCRTPSSSHSHTHTHTHTIPLQAAHPTPMSPPGLSPLSSPHGGQTAGFWGSVGMATDIAGNGVGGSWGWVSGGGGAAQAKEGREMKERVVEHVCAALCNLSFENDALRIQLGQLGACAFEYAPHTHTFSLSLSNSTSGWPFFMRKQVRMPLSAPTTTRRHFFFSVPISPRDLPVTHCTCQPTNQSHAQKRESQFL